MRRELLFRNPAGLIPPPKVAAKEMTTLDGERITIMLEAMRETQIYPQIILLSLECDVANLPVYNGRMSISTAKSYRSSA